jgi:hypothetical protein
MAALIALTAFIGSAGGVVFHLLGFPAPWLTGSVVAASTAVLCGVKLVMPQIVRQITFLVLGVSIGAGVDPETVSGIAKWPASIAILCIAVIITIIASTAYLSSRAGWNRSTAFFSSLPGALSYVMIMSMRSNADTPLVVLAQMMRVVTLLLLIPVIITSFTPVPVLTATAENSGVLEELAVFGAGAVVGLIFERLKFPAGMLFGGMLASAALHVSSLVEGQIRPEILIPSQILLGCLMGLRFSGTDPRLLLRALGPAAGSFVITLAISMVGALLVWWLFGLPLNQLLIAFAPGALEIMVILAFVLGLDPAFVAAHHLVRFIGIALTLPLLVRLFLPPPQQPDEEKD